MLLLLSNIPAMKSRIWNEEHNAIYISTLKNGILGYISNKVCIRSIQENYSTPMKDIRELNKWRASPCSWRGRLNIVKMPVLPNLIYRFNAMPIKILAYYLVDINKLNLKFTYQGKRSRTANAILEAKNKVRGLTLPNFKTDYLATVINRGWNWRKNRQMNQ